MTRPNRNELCPCGSGRKHKKCCGVAAERARASRAVLLALAPVALLAGLGLYAVAAGRTPADEKTEPGAVAAPANAQAPAGVPSAQPAPAAAPQAATASTPLPAGADPEKFVWSPEHGHWHDKAKLAAPSPGPSPIVVDMEGAPGGAVQTSGTDIRIDANAMTPPAGAPLPKGQPGPAPEGKYWSSEHGHWHDKPKNLRTIHLGTVNAPPVPTPQPGPAPAGMVWSAEHGHWHRAVDNPQPAPAAGTTAPTTTQPPTQR